tara:strand:- start:3066 stop:8906 length:5841 start_codon:yes stop_codon:yes gene_type:complete
MTSAASRIRIRGARQNNLAGVDVDLPRNALVAVTGVSGSGKSSLAFDTLYREGQRRFLETLSAYARQFLGDMRKPDVDAVEGLSPAIAVDQRSVPRGSRSTVGTLTEITDHLRVLFARAGVAHCPGCEQPMQSRTPESVVQEILRDHAGEKVHLCAPMIRDRKGAHKALFGDLAKRGFVRVRVDGEVIRIEEAPELERYKRHSIEVVVDRLKPDPEDPGRLRESVEQAIEVGEGDVMVVVGDEARILSTQRTCPGCGEDVPPLEPRLFSFNSPHGACPTCDGIGVLRRPSEAALITDRTLTIREGCLAVTRAKGGALNFPKASFSFLERIGQDHDFDLDTPWKSISAEGRKAILRGTGDERFADKASWNGAKFAGEVKWKRKWTGVLTAIEEACQAGKRTKQLERYLSLDTCVECDGSRLRRAAGAVRIGHQRLPMLLGLPVEDLGQALASLEMTTRQARIARDLLIEIERRTEFLLRVGLGYLTLDRAADTLSGGEAQRIRLAAQLGAGLQGVLYVLDEPSIGLHARDHGRLLGALEDLRDAGNSVIVVEHDEATLRAADWVIDVGPGAGSAGGHIVAVGHPADVAKADTPTGRVLRGEVVLPAPKTRRTGNGHALIVRGADAFNLQSVDASIPLGTLTVITGVSGSGKSTLIERTLRPAIERHLGREAPEPGAHDRIEGLEHLDEMVAINAAPIGRTTRSNPATYTKVLGPIRDLFASLPEAKLRGYDKSRFSFNIEGGRCENCQGSGARFIELQFLAAVTVPCEECGGHRFQAETLDVRFKEHSIADVLACTAEEALALFGDHPKIKRPLELMVDVGLGYLTLGQPSTTISGGEAQRLKLVTHLSKKATGHTLYLLDEPTTGLHQEDVGRLVGALQRLVDMGHTVVVVEHNLELIRTGDHVIDLGPEGGAGGGRILVTGTPEVIAKHKTSYTGAALRELDGKRTEARGRKAPKNGPGVAPPTSLRITGARAHNLKGIDVELPRNALTVVTGPSGSGKSSLALDTIHTEGRRRFVESLSTYARQFLGVGDRPPFEKIEGLGPSVAVEAATVGSHPRSTVATTTEIHDHLRVLWARAGQPKCPKHGQDLQPGDPSQVTKRIIKDAAEHGADTKGWLLAPIYGGHAPFPADLKAELERRKEAWTGAGFARLLIDGKEVRLDGPIQVSEAVAYVDLVVDRIGFTSKSRARLAEGVEQASAISHGRVSAMIKDGPRLEYSTRGACTECGFQLDGDLEPRHFSFNAHVGACPDCGGLGDVVRCDPEKLIDDADLKLCDGAIEGKLGRYLTKGKGFYEMLLRHVAKAHRIDLERPFSKFTDKQKDLVLHGIGAKDNYEVHLDKTSTNVELHEVFRSDWPGLCGHVDAWHQKTDDAEWAAILEKVMRKQVCGTCEGERLAPGPRSVVVGRKRLPQMLKLNVEEAGDWLSKLKLKGSTQDAVAPVIAELRSRLRLLAQVGLGYVTLERGTATLSGGEARRVRLSASLGSELVGVCYVLDEPTVGLHPRDVDRLTDALLELRDRGNTVIVVEHDAALMRRADHVLDIGPGAGELGGRLVASGTPAEVMKHKTSGTAAHLRGEIRLGKDDPEFKDHGHAAGPLTPLRLTGVHTQNLRGVDLEVPFGKVTGVCGPSGSGKSSLVLDSLVPALRGEPSNGRWERFRGIPGGSLRTVVVDAAPIGRTPHSVPATYAGLMQPLRELFARTPEARMRGFGPPHFSFNSTKGRCPACEGRGSILVEMQFLADLWLPCEECDGLRYRPEVLEIRFRGRNLAEILAMTIDEAAAFLSAQPAASSILKVLQAVGLGYLRLGQGAPTLSGGEAQRLKLASELQRAGGGQRSVIILDEPSTGLAATDLVHLARTLLRLARRGDAVLLIEHNTELLGICDHLIELGPEGGEAGGLQIAQGTPAELAANPDSITGPWLPSAKAHPPQAKKPARKKAASRKKAKGARS